MRRTRRPALYEVPPTGEARRGGKTGRTPTPSRVEPYTRVSLGRTRRRPTSFEVSTLSITSVLGTITTYAAPGSPEGPTRSGRTRPISTPSVIRFTRSTRVAARPRRRTSASATPGTTGSWTGRATACPRSTYSTSCRAAPATCPASNGPGHR